MIDCVNRVPCFSLISERVRAAMSRVPDEAVAQAASVPFVPSGGDQTGVVLQR